MADFHQNVEGGWGPAGESNQRAVPPETDPGVSGLPLMVRAAWLAARFGKPMLASYRARYAKPLEKRELREGGVAGEVDTEPALERHVCLSNPRQGLRMSKVARLSTGSLNRH